MPDHDRGLTRRHALLAAGLLGANALNPASAYGQTPAASRLDLGTPSDQLRGMVRLRGAEDLPFWLLIEGQVYGRDPHSVIQPLFGFASLLRIHYRRIDEARYSFEQRESAHYSDSETGQPIGEFYNPYKDEMNFAVGYVSPRFSYHFGLDGTTSPSQPDHVGHLPHPLTNMGGLLRTTERRYLSYPTRLDLEEFPEASRSTTRRSVDIATFRARRDDVIDLSNPFVQAAVDFVADTEWPFWMFMGDRPGNAWWLGHGAKFETTSDLPNDVRRRVDQVHPGFLEDPWEFDGSTYRTDYQMKALREAGRL